MTQYKTIQWIHNIKQNRYFSFIEEIYDLYWYVKCQKKKSFSQTGEDQFVLDFFANKKNGTYVDVGANHPFRISNTYLLYKLGWRGVTIEPIPRLFNKHLKWRPMDVQLNCAVGKSKEKLTFYELTPGVLSTFNKKQALTLIEQSKAKLVKSYEIETISLKEVFDKYLKNQFVDLLSIDTEGHDLFVLQSMDWNKFRPRLIIVESTIPDNKKPDDEIDILLKEMSYKMIKTSGANSIYAFQVN